MGREDEQWTARRRRHSAASPIGGMRRPRFPSHSSRCRPRPTWRSWAPAIPASALPSRWRGPGDPCTCSTRCGRRRRLDPQWRHHQRQFAAQPFRDDPQASARPAATRSLPKSRSAREDLYRFIADEKIDCDFAMAGRSPAPPRPATMTTWRATRSTCTAPSASSPYAVPPRRAARRPGHRTSTMAVPCAWTLAACIRPSCLAGDVARSPSRPGPRSMARPLSESIRGDGGIYEVTTPRGVVRAATSSSAPTATPTGPTKWLRRRLCPCAAASSPPSRSRQPDGPADAAADDVQRDPPLQLLLPPLPRRHAHPLRRPRRHHRRRSRLADRAPAPRSWSGSSPSSRAPASPTAGSAMSP